MTAPDAVLKNAGMTLYYAPNTCALASHIALESVGADYEAVRIDLSAGEQPSERFLNINPAGRVPALATRWGVLTETPAILLFICQSDPEHRLAPLDDPFELARMNAFNSYLCSTVHVAHAHRMRGYRWADGEDAVRAMRSKVPQSVGDCFETIEHKLFRGPWVLGDAYTTSDIYLFTIAQWLEADGVDVARFPKVLRHRDRVRNLPATERVLARELDHA
jgi:glutathione S-transferase